jgi:hypothetical protein
MINAVEVFGLVRDLDWQMKEGAHGRIWTCDTCLRSLRFDAAYRLYQQLQFQEQPLQ